MYEPHLDELLEEAREQRRIEFTMDLSRAVRGSEVIFIAVGAPSMPSGEANLEDLEAAARSIGVAMDGTRRRLVVNKSTVPVGSGNLVEALVREGMEEDEVADIDDVSFAVVSNPEFLREGCAIADTLYGDPW
jgi:UDPglucose 6-dehydrogenase